MMRLSLLLFSFSILLLMLILLLLLLLLFQKQPASGLFDYDVVDTIITDNSYSNNNNNNNNNTNNCYANQFPTLTDTIEMSKLSKLVYHFRHESDDYCDTYANDNDDGVVCEWYTHNYILGTQVLLVSNWRKNYIAVVFAGTDDIRTSLEDVHLTQKPYGNNSTISLHNKQIKVHSGFDNAVFTHGLWENIYTKVTNLLLHHHQQQQNTTTTNTTSTATTTRIFTTGHSLGAANSILVATALSLKGYKVTSINFGCPKTGNDMWKEYFDNSNANNNSSNNNKHSLLDLNSLKDRLSIWRVVLGWDLIPRLPDFNFYHVGHTIQIWTKDDHNHNIYPKNASMEVEVYYQHYGNTTLGYAGPPKNWNTVPHYYFPVDWMYHFMSKYVNHLEDLQYYYEPELWVNAFKRTTTKDSSDDDNHDDNNNDTADGDGDDDDDDYDDDYYISPDDYYEMDELDFFLQSIRRRR